MRTAKNAKGSKKSKPSEQIHTSLYAALAVILSAALIAFTAADCENYSETESVEAALTFTPPKKQEPMGFWDIFTKAVVSLFES